MVEVVNTSITAYNRSIAGGQVWHADLNSFLSLSGNGCVDPEVIWWSWDNRFAFVCSVLNVNTIKVVVSASANPTPPNQWCIYTFTPPAFVDQPSITATADKIGISGTRVDNGDGYAVVFQKSSMLSCSSTRSVGNERSHAAYRAAVHNTNEFDAKFVTVGGGLWLLNASGTPDQGNVTFTETKIENKGYSNLSDPATPGGNVGGGDLDNRFMSATQELVAGHYIMELESTENCGTGLCNESVRIDFTSCSCVTHTWTFGASGVNYIYGSGTLDPSGNVFISYSRVANAFTPQAAAMAVNGSGTVKWNRVIKGSTAGTTSCDTATCDERWGDYLGAAPDPAVAGQVWVAGEYQLSSGEFGWGTVIAAASITGLSPTAQSTVWTGSSEDVFFATPNGALDEFSYNNGAFHGP
ncbi:MAG: hypothetical protein M3Q30_12165, partial [Actinomycetota bacterium]|nr:hypothetical protein [Actinomycetota bacterium]